MTPLFEAGFLAVEEDEGVMLVGLADREFETERALLLQRSLKPSQHDISLGHGQVHITIDDQSRSRYGGIRLIELFERELRVSLSGEAAVDLDLSEDFAVSFVPELVDTDLLSSALNRLLDQQAVRFLDRR